MTRTRAEESKGEKPKLILFLFDTKIAHHPQIQKFPQHSPPSLSRGRRSKRKTASHLHSQESVASTSEAEMTTYSLPSSPVKSVPAYLE